MPDADYRLLIERGRLLESFEMAREKPIQPAYYWGLCEAVLETRNILATREHSIHSEGPSAGQGRA